MASGAHGWSELLFIRAQANFTKGIGIAGSAAFEPVLYFDDGDVRADSPLHQTFYASKLCS
jgi:hypothetical protein